MVRHPITDIAFAIDFSTYVKPTAGNQVNMQHSGISTPIYGILYDGTRFWFFLFDGNTKPYKFSKGVVAGKPSQIYKGLQLGDFSSKLAAHPFVLDLRPICKTVFNLFLVTYSATLKVFREQIKTA